MDNTFSCRIIEVAQRARPEMQLVEGLICDINEGCFATFDRVTPHLWARFPDADRVWLLDDPPIRGSLPELLSRVATVFQSRDVVGALETCLVFEGIGLDFSSYGPEKQIYMKAALQEAMEDGTVGDFPGKQDYIYLVYRRKPKAGAYRIEIFRDELKKIQSRTGPCEEAQSKDPIRAWLDATALRGT